MAPNHDPEESFLSLTDVAQHRGVHYMTVYRHVRTGRLPAVKVNGEWRVHSRDLTYSLNTAPTGTPGNADLGRRLGPIHDRLIAGDEPGAWSIIESCLGAGADPVEIHHQLIVPVLERIGDTWAQGMLRIVDEHTATAIIYRLVARLGPQLRSKGRSRGTIVIGSVAGDHHALTSSIVADLLRNARFTVVDLGGNTPAQSFVDAVRGVDQCRAVGISVSIEADAAVTKTVDLLRANNDDLTILVGGRGIRDAAHALGLGSAGYAGCSRDIVPLFEEAILAGSRLPTVAVPAND